MRRLASLCFAIAISLSAVCFAQDAANPAAVTSVDAREAFRRGEAAYSAGNYDQAIREWSSAYKIDPRPRIQFNLSQAYERLGDLENAMAALRNFLDSGDPDDPMYSDANARLAALQQRMALTGVVVRGGGDGGQILVDDKDWGRTPRPDKIPLSPGNHTLVVRWLARQEFRTNIVVPAGQVIEVNVPDEGGGDPLPHVPGGSSAGSSTGGSAQVDSSGGSNKILFYAVGGAAAGLGVGALVYGIVRSGDAIDCGGDTYCPDPDAADAAATQSLVGYVAGGVLLAGGAALIVMGALSKDDQQQASTQCGVGFASASCRVRF